MGYRSEVALALTTDAAVLLKELCEHSKDLREIVEDGIDATDWRSDAIQNGNTIIFYWCDIKWYEGYPGITQIQAFMDNTESEEWRFLRIGEDFDDATEEGHFYDSGIHISRSIVV